MGQQSTRDRHPVASNIIVHPSIPYFQTSYYDLQYLLPTATSPRCPHAGLLTFTACSKQSQRSRSFRCHATIRIAPYHPESHLSSLNFQRMAQKSTCLFFRARHLSWVSATARVTLRLPGRGHPGTNSPRNHRESSSRPAASPA